MASSEGDQLLAGAFYAIMGKIEADILQVAKEVELEISFHASRILFQKDSTKVRTPSRLTSEVWARCKDFLTTETRCKNRLKLIIKKKICV